MTSSVHLQPAQETMMQTFATPAPITVGAAAGVSAVLDAGTTVGRISNALQNAGGTPGLKIHATTTVGDITARSLGVADQAAALFAPSTG